MHAARNATTAASFLPPRKNLPALREAARGCKACPLWQIGTQTVLRRPQRTASL